MSIIGSNVLAGASGSGVSAYEIEQSLRFDNSSAAHLSRTLSASGNRRTFTLSWWLKRGKLNNGTCGPWIWYGANGYESFGVSFSDEALRVSANVEAVSNVFDKKTTALYRDPSAWMHIVVAIDTTLSTAADRVKIYVNGERITAFSGQNNNPSQNHQMKWNDHTLTQRWIRGNSGHFDGYQAEIHHVDGTALDPTTFGEYDDNGVWRPIEVDLTTSEYGTQGFYLDFSDASDLGADRSGNGNDWTLNNFTVNPGSYVLATKTSGTFSTGTLRDVFDTNSGNSGGVYSEATTGSEAASTIDIEFSSALSGTITVTASDGTSGTNTGAQYQLIDSTDTVQVTQARPTTTTTYTHTGQSDITKLRLYGGSAGLGGILISRFESSEQTIRSYDWLAEGDVYSDTPTTNWATLNPIYRSSYADTNLVYSEGNLKVTSNANNKGAVANFAVSSGKWYYEAAKTKDEMIGWHPADTALTNFPGHTAGVSFHTGGSVFHAGTSTAYGSSNTAVLIGCAVDFDNEKFYWSIDGTWQNSADPAAGTGGFSFPTDCQDVPLVPAFRVRSATSTENIVFNAGQRGFAYTPPTGFKALSTSNLPAPAIADGSEYFEAITYTGDGNSTQEITTSFEPDFVWNKSRNQGFYHRAFDRLRGTLDKALYPSEAFVEDNVTDFGEITATSATSVTVGQGGDSGNLINTSGYTHVLWNWKAGGSGSSNTDGSITSTVSANATAGFSIVSYTGNATSGATIGHGLGVAPSMVIVKNRDESTAHWHVFHEAIGNTKYVLLSIDNTVATASNRWNDTSPSSTVVTLGNHVSVNGNDDKLIAYCFAEVEGYSKISEFTGNGSTDGSFVYCGFKPSWILLRRYGASRNWYLYDGARSSYNVADHLLYPDLVNQEASTDALDILSNGFKMRTTNASLNGSGDKILFLAFASNPFGGSGVSPATAR